MEIEALSIKQNKKGQEVLSLTRHVNGQQSVKLLPDIFKSTIQSMKLPIAMHWGENKGPFIRPVKWLCAIIDDEVINFELFGVQSSNTTYGHRFLSQGGHGYFGTPVELTSATQYKQKLLSVNVLVDINDRKEKIQSELINYYTNKDQIDHQLLAEVIHLVEWPNVLKIEFPKSFLELPKEVLTECLKKHQKAFTVTDQNELKNECYVVVDSLTTQNEKNIIEGNKKVMFQG